MRLFTAIDLPEPMKAALGQICYGLPRIRWLPTDQFHLTLVFIGEVNPAQVEPIQEALTEVPFAPLPLTCGGIGSFRSGALWLNVAREPALLELETRIRRQLRSVAGLQLPARRYSPHITLGRMDPQHPPRLDNFLTLHEGNRYSFEAQRFALKESQLTLQGALHRTLDEFGPPRPSPRPRPRPRSD